jgi:phosphoribosyl-dephospho-CoA transferase
MGGGAYDLGLARGIGGSRILEEAELELEAENPTGRLVDLRLLSWHGSTAPRAASRNCGVFITK